MEHHLTERELIEYRFRLALDDAASATAEHLAGCAECRSRLEQLNRKFASLDLLREDVQVSPDLISQVVEQAKQPPAVKIVPFIRRPWVGAVAAVLLVGFAVLIGTLTKEQPAKLKFTREKQQQAVSNGQLSSQSEVDKNEETMVVASKPSASSETMKSLTDEKADMKMMMAKEQPAVVPSQEAGNLAPAKVKADMYAMAPAKDAEHANESVKNQITSGAAGAAAPEALTEQPPFAPASAIELVTLPRREKVQLTIYNSADLTLVRERRNLSLKKGWNWLQLMWANTLIDPTSLSLEPLEQKDKIDIQQLVFPARLRELGRWLIRSQISGQVPFEITYFTSGLSWRAFYMGTLSRDEKTMKLEGYVRVANNSGEDYENTQTRLIVGQVHLLDQIRELAQRQYPYGSPVLAGRLGGGGGLGGAQYNADKDASWFVMNGTEAGRVLMDSLDRKEIRKEGLSEYFLYTIEGTETIPNQWGKRLLSFEAQDIAVESLYKYDEQRWGDQTIRFVKFANDKKHNLGQTPIPNGDVKIYGLADEEGHLSYVGGTSVKYIPVDEEVELNLGPARVVQVEPKLMDYKTESYVFDNNGNVAGWDEIRTWRIEMTNTSALPIEIEITRVFGTTYWTLKADAPHEKYDATHARFKQQLEPASKRTLEYMIRTYHGLREQAFPRGQ